MCLHCWFGFIVWLIDSFPLTVNAGHCFQRYAVMLMRTDGLSSMSASNWNSTATPQRAHFEIKSVPRHVLLSAECLQRTRAHILWKLPGNSSKDFMIFSCKALLFAIHKSQWTQPMWQSIQRAATFSNRMHCFKAMRFSQSTQRTNATAWELAVALMFAQKEIYRFMELLDFS